MTDPMEDVRRIWSVVLGAEVHEVDTNFFDAGGHSLLLMVLQEHLEELAQCQIAIEDLFEHPTIREQAGLITARAATDTAADTRLRARDRSQLLGRSRANTAGERP